MGIRLKTASSFLALSFGVLVLSVQALGTEPSNCLEIEKKAEALGEKVEGVAQEAREAAQEAVAEGTPQATDRAKAGAQRVAVLAEAAAKLVGEARALGCYKAQAIAETAHGAAKEAKEEIRKTVNLLEGLKPRFLDPGTPEYERYWQEKEVSPSQ